MWNIFSASFKFIHIRSKGKRGAIIIFPHSVQIPEYFMQYNNNLSKVKKTHWKAMPYFLLSNKQSKNFLHILISVHSENKPISKFYETMWIMRMNHELSVWIMRIMRIIYKTSDTKFDSAKNFFKQKALAIIFILFSQAPRTTKRK